MRMCFTLTDKEHGLTTASGGGMASGSSHGFFPIGSPTPLLSGERHDNGTPIAEQ